MKNVILGIVGAFVVLYTVVLSLGMYSVNTREDELEDCLSEVMLSTMEKYYVSPETAPFQTAGDADMIKAELTEMLRLRINSKSELEVSIKECDMQLGILSVEVSGKFTLPNGKTKEVSCKKTLIADRGQ